MTLQVKCDNCGQLLQLQGEAFSEMLPCPKCQHYVKIHADSSGDMRDKWTWADIVIGCLIPSVVILLIVVLTRFLGSYLHPQQLYWIAALLFFAFPISIVIYTVGIFRKRKVALPIKCGSWITFLKAILLSLAVCLFILFLTLLVNLFFRVILGEDVSVDNYARHSSFSGNAFVYITYIVSLFTVFPVCEELFFRGFLYTALRSRIPWLWAILIQAVFFTLLHRVGTAHSLMVFFTGFILCFIYEKKKNLLVPILVHSLNNFMIALYVLTLFVLNYHTPAQTWEEARTDPDWFCVQPPAYVEQMETGSQQRQYAIETWGSLGSREWKKELNAFNAVFVWFPQEQQACAEAKLGIVYVYVDYLHDYRRAIVHAEELIHTYPQMREICAQTCVHQAYAYWLLGDMAKCKRTLEVILSEYSDYDYPTAYAETLLARIGNRDPG